eukprot:TRINITY_DN38009_c0_g1_i1.p1 TRINITY_DN38009_c0_g1~~TRINITY_DN38009_c0_g1_i1.p1  ORF type:complete len:500 (+),score=90.91 TRINITY_DN38009_c0_g1_i1:35-1534(+)
MNQSLSRRGAVDEGEPRPSEVCIISVKHSGECGALPDILGNGSFNWIQRGSKDMDEQVLQTLRQEGAKLTAATCRLCRYEFDGQVVSLKHMKDMQAGTRIVNAVSPSPAPQHFSTEWEEHDEAHMPATAITINAAILGQSVALLNPACAYNVGGQFAPGGCHGLEESVCTQSTLHSSLLHAAQLAERQGVVAPRSLKPPRSQYGSWQSYIPENGCILSPKVEFFRGDFNEGYMFLEAPVVAAAVVSIAMPNCNPELKDVPVDAPENREQYLKLIQNKITAALDAAISAKATVLVVPALGCSSYKNKPEDIAQIFSEVVASYCPRAFDEIHCVGPRAFTNLCTSKPKMSLLGPSAGKPAPPPLDTLPSRSVGKSSSSSVAPPASSSLGIPAALQSTGKPSEDLQRSLQTLKNSVTKVSGDFVDMMTQGERKLASCSKEGLLEQQVQYRKEAQHLREERQKIQTARETLEEKRAEAAKSKDQLKAEIEEVMAAKSGGCCVS